MTYTKILIYRYMQNMRWRFVIVALMDAINSNLKRSPSGGNTCLEGTEIVQSFFNSTLMLNQQ